MTRPDNEQEFVLGNRQLLSAFFVVMLLLGVFFTMGYIVGQNTDRTKKQPAQTEPAATGAAAPPPAETHQDPVPVPSSAADQAPPVQTAPARETPVETPAEKPVERPRAAAEETPRIESAPGHTYLQVSAVKRPAADSIVKTLKDKGFPALLGESSKPGLFRVLVGPYAETETLSKAKSDLKAMGFDAVVSK